MNCIIKCVPIIFLVSFLSNCASHEEYADTDVLDVQGFELKTAADVERSGGTLQRGTLVYSGKGKLQEVYRTYLTAMRAHGWVGGEEEMTADRAVGTLYKDSRICSLDFTTWNESIKAIVTVTKTKGEKK